MANKREDADARARESFTEKDKALAAQDPDYGETLSQIKQNYAAASTEEERRGWHNEAEKLSNAYGYTRNDDGSRVTRLESNLQTIKNFDNAYGKEDKSGYRSVINALLTDISGAKFKYDAKSDPRYALAQDYAAEAMRNQAAESAALTGGYGNSYGAAVGQQIYDDTMKSAADSLEDRAYTRFRDEADDKYQRLSTLIGLENTDYSRALDRESTDYSRAEAEKADARTRLEAMLGNGSAPEDIPDSLKAASALSDAEIAAIYGGVQTGLRADTASDARGRVDAYLQNGGDPSALPAELLSASGYTDAELSAARESVLESLREQRYKAYGGGTGKTSTDASSVAADDGDAKGLFTAAYRATAYGETTPEEFITKNYKAFGFSSAAGLIGQYDKHIDKDGNWIDTQSGDATDDGITAEMRERVTAAARENRKDSVFYTIYGYFTRGALTAEAGTRLALSVSNGDAYFFLKGLFDRGDISAAEANRLAQTYRIEDDG